MSCSRYYESSLVVFNFVLPGVLHGDEKLGKIPRNASSNLILSNKCPWLASCLGAQANANFAPSKCVTRSQVAVVVSLNSSHHWLARLRYANHIASDTYNHLLFSVNIEIWSHWQKVGIWRLQGNNSIVIVPWFEYRILGCFCLKMDQ